MMNSKQYKIHMMDDSMEPRIYKGDTLIVVDCDQVTEQGVYISTMDNDIVCKNITPSPTGLLFTDNKGESHFYSDKDIKQQSVHIIGRVIETRRILSD